MLVVKTYLADTGPKGIGLYAGEIIKSGSVWWKDNRQFNRVIPVKEVELYDECAKEFIHKYAYLEENKQWYLCVDNARFINHSKTPNTILGENGDWIAKHDIRVGEEITSDYSQFYDNDLTFKDLS